jgi:hypothetical protein
MPVVELWRSGSERGRKGGRVSLVVGPAGWGEFGNGMTRMGIRRGHGYGHGHGHGYGRTEDEGKAWV